MERLTHEADFGLEDWEETLFFVKSDPNGAYNILDIAKYQGESEFDEILKNVALRLAAYENTGLEPEEIKAIAGLASENCAKTADAIDKLLQDDAELKSYRELGSIDRLRELAQADREGRCVVLPESYYTAEAAARKASGPAEQSERGQAAAWIMQRFGQMS